MAYLTGYYCQYCGKFQPLLICDECLPVAGALQRLSEAVSEAIDEFERETGRRIITLGDGSADEIDFSPPLYIPYADSAGDKFQCQTCNTPTDDITRPCRWCGNEEFYRIEYGELPVEMTAAEQETPTSTNV
jgi:hypothetical protein